MGSHLVGQNVANAWRLHDMRGDVSEWVRDFYRDYPGGAVTDPAGSESGCQPDGEGVSDKLRKWTDARTKRRRHTHETDIGRSVRPVARGLRLDQSVGSAL